MKIGTTDINNVYIGSTAINTVYIGTTQIFPNNTLLLDTYTGAAAAYSLRKLRTAYSGSAIRVRRSSDNAEQDIGFSGNDLDTSSLTTFCSGTNGFVVTWYDQSGAGKNATQSTAASQPQIVSSGSVITQGSKPALSLDGTDDNFTFTNHSTLSAFYISTVITASSSIGSTVTKGIFSSSNTNSNTGMLILANTSGNKWGTFGGGVQNATTDIRDSLQHLLTMTSANSDSGNFYLDSVGDGTFTATQSQDQAAIGGISTTTPKQCLLGYMQELVFYTTDKSSDRSGIEGNINTYYGIY